ncbi:prolipoprotein diacylglyceryl transferase [bacterium]|nr:prolipoprotein diacylglyceryl transferase [bacterium]
MFNDLFSVFGQTVHTYGFLMAVGFTLAVILVKKKGAPFGFGGKELYDFAFYTLIIALIGARLLFILTNLKMYSNLMQNGDYFAPIRVWDGGLVFFGGFISASIYFILYARKKGKNVFLMADLLSLGATIGHSVGRLGCFSAGCCYGVPTDSFVGVQFPENSIPYDDHLNLGLISNHTHHSLAIHPTQLYEAGALFLIFLFLWFRFDKKRFNGEIALLYLTIYSIERFIVEIFRGDGVRGYLFKFTSNSINSILGLPEGHPIILTTSQTISLVLISITIFIYKKSRDKSLLKTEPKIENITQE